MSKLFIALGMISTLASAADAADQFDLVCHGLKGYSFQKQTPNERHYIVDLKAGFWCYRDSTARPGQICYGARVFKEVTPSRLTLDEEPAPNGRAISLHSINRDTGAYLDMDGSGVEGGTCEAAAFSGLPAGAKF